MVNEVKLALLIAAVMALFGSGYYVGGLAPKASLARLQSAWDKDKLAIQQAADRALADANAQKDMAIKANEGIANDYQSKLSAANADAESLARRLRDAEGRAAHPDSVPKAGDLKPVIAAGEDAGLQRLNGLLTDSLTECRSNSAQLNALIAEIQKQL